ncbi:MAG: helix-turn-helix transcriptional regulator [Gammaproteobacteria bacterium]|nr:helix-turn-helix transcriptional regulator [Gammaproteobacteria bacterium]
MNKAVPRVAPELLETKDAPKRILDAAADLFTRLGYSKTTMSEIADKACVFERATLCLFSIEAPIA